MIAARGEKARKDVTAHGKGKLRRGDTVLQNRPQEQNNAFEMRDPCHKVQMSETVIEGNVVYTPFRSRHLGEPPAFNCFGDRPV